MSGVFGRRSVKPWLAVLLLAFGGGLVFSQPTFAAEADCPPGTTPAPGASLVIASQPDQSVGEQGQPQTMSVVANDQPSEGATFVLTSLRLSLVDNPVPGSTVGDDGKTVIVPGEGTYVANDDGTITFTPLPSFVGTARGVRYSIRDTAGKMTSNIYRPIVKGTPPPVCDPTVSQMVLPERQVGLAGALEGSPHLVSDASKLKPWTSLASSADGQIVTGVAGQEGIYRSLDGGATWTQSYAAGSTYWSKVASSADGQSVAVIPGTWLTSPPIVSTDGGATWTLPASAQTSGWIDIAVSSDGQTMVGLTQREIYISHDNGATWQGSVPVSGARYHGLALANNGQTITLLTSAGISRSQDSGSTWITLNQPPDLDSSATWAGLSGSADGQKLVAYSPYSSGISYSPDGGNTWSVVTPPDGNIMSAQLSTDGSMILVFNAVTMDVISSRDAGQSWTKLLDSTGNYYTDSGVAYSTGALSSNAQQLVVASYNPDGGYVYTSSDGGASWQLRDNTPVKVDPNLIDLDPATPGQQLTMRNDTEGWVATYNPEFDEYHISIDPQKANPYYDASTDSYRFSTVYTVITPEGCLQPTPGKIIIRLTQAPA